MTDEFVQGGTRVPSVTVKGVRGMIHFGVSRGLSRAAILGASGIEQKTLDDPDGRIGRSQVACVWRYIADAIDDPALPLSVIQALPYGTYDVLDYAFATSQTVAEGVGVVQRYLRLFIEMAELEIEERGDETVIWYQLLNDEDGLERYSSEFTFGLLVSRLRQCADHANANPEWVAFSHESKADPAIYEAWYGCPVRFGAAANRLALATDLYRAPMLTADPGLHSVMERHAQVLLEQTPALDAIDVLVRRELYQMFTGGESQPSIDDVGRRLGMSGRTLQRKLSDQDTNFARLLDETRYELALRFLDDESVSIGEVGFLLGFSEPSAFNRAFRRWSGDTPGALRKRLQR